MQNYYMLNLVNKKRVRETKKYIMIGNLIENIIKDNRNLFRH